MAAALVATIPAAATAQDEAPTTPEGIDWALTAYFDDGTAEMVSLPFGLEATLRLQDGIASGSGGCNQFSGTYEIDGTSLSFGEEMTVTLALCEDGAQMVEDAYLAALGKVDGWTIAAGALELSDGLGDVILTFEVPHILWTTSQMTGLMTTLNGLQIEIATLRSDTDALNVDKLRERIKVLESENRKARKRLDALEDTKSNPTPKPSVPTSFSSAEKVLLEGVPARIENHCAPLRSSLPKGTRAAVACKPNTSAVSSVNYYLMEGDDAAAIFGATMSTFNVPQAVSDTKTCEQGFKSQRQWLGGGWQADGCYRTNERAEVRFIDNATECRKLKVGGKTLQSPAFYIALQGNDNDVERVHGWATKGLDPNSSQLTSITVPIKRPNAGWSPSCPQ